MAGQCALDVGCGPGALTGVLVDRLGATAVLACDPSEPFAAECAARHPGVDVRIGRAEAIPIDDGCVDAALAQLVLHFVSDAPAAAAEMRRVVRPGGTVGEISALTKSDIWINGGFFVMRNEIFRHMYPGEELVREPFQRLIEKNALLAYKCSGFWQCMDTFREYELLTRLWEENEAPWRVWK